MQITPFVDEDVTGMLGDRMRRVSDIGFNACLLQDLHLLIELREIAQNEWCNDPQPRGIERINLHLIMFQTPTAVIFR